LTFTTAPRAEWHAARNDRRQIVVSVRDEGIGIPDAERARLFQRFARAANAADMDIPGTGLGLYLCRALIEAQGGRVWLARSELGRGSTFSFTLPAWQAMPSPTTSLPGIALAHTLRH
jgi:signal transduction histidine kinase